MIFLSVSFLLLTWFQSKELIIHKHIVNNKENKLKDEWRYKKFDFVTNDSQLVVITEVQSKKRAYENGPPWLLNNAYIKSFERNGLKRISNTTNSETEMGEEIHLTIFQR